MTESRIKHRGAFRLLPYMGVIAVVADAEKLGFYNGHPDWVNIGQGQPEVGDLEGAPERINSLEMIPIDHAYGPVHGTPELRQAVADYYNRIHRRGKASQYGPDNVAIAAGGRLALSRIMVTLKDGCRVGYQVPDYSAYEDMLFSQAGRIETIPILAREEDGFGLPGDCLPQAVREHNLEAFLISNPCNPTGVVVQGADLAPWVQSARDQNCTLIADEFYSQFIYTADGQPGAGPVSSAQFVEDVDRDPVLIVDGLTKGFRYPGWRVAWVLGPKDLIECFITAASSIDGGPSRLNQRLALQALEEDRADQETQAVRVNFAKKRNLMIERLSEFGVRFVHDCEGTFYLWGCLDQVKAPYNQAEAFYREALERKVMVVPGHYFDVNPGGSRGESGAFDQWMRFSFGPPYADVERAMDRLAEFLKP